MLEKRQIPPSDLRSLLAAMTALRNGDLRVRATEGADGSRLN
ncbi:hypothetical protein [Streptomyces himalayensis]|nr:hypothetical protein [Streptomyces himalayensis]